ncbi:MAG: hypothetical protein P4L46_25510 [Fimbriimonas sp.]|nr:hypothetical protein [Fimbriimonas sp.]
MTSLRHILARVELTFRLFLEDRGIGLLHNIHKSGLGRPETQRVSPAVIQGEGADELRRRLKEVEDGINAAGIPFKRTTSGQDLKDAIDVLRDLAKKGSGGEAKTTDDHDLPKQIELLDRRHKQLSSVLASIGILFGPEDPIDELAPQIEAWVRTRQPVDVQKERGRAAVELACPSEDALRLSEMEKALAEAGIRLKRNEPVRLLADAIEAIKSRQVDASGESKLVRELQDKVRSLEEEFKSKEAFAERAFVEAKDGYQKELAALKKANASLEERIAATLKTTAKQLDKVDEEKQELAGKSDVLRIRNGSLEADAAAKTAEADELKLLNNELAGQSRDRGAAIELLKQELAAVKLTLTQATERMGASAKQVVTLTATVERKEKEEVALRRRLDALQDAFADSQMTNKGRIEALQNQCHDLAVERTQLSEKVAGLEAQLEELTTELQANDDASPSGASGSESDRAGTPTKRARKL